MSLDNVKPLLAEYAHINAQKKELEARLKELDQQVRPVLADIGEVVVAGFSFTCMSMPGRKTLDQKAMEADGIDLEKYRKQGAPFTQLKVKAVKEL